MRKILTKNLANSIIFMVIKMMVINYDIEKLEAAVKDFYNSTGVNINFLKDDFTSLTDRKLWHESYCSKIQQSFEGRKRCLMSDRSILEKCSKSKKTEVRICHAGLVDVAAPVVYNDSVVAYIILGQMKKDDDFSLVRKYVSDLGLDVDKLQADYDKMTLYDEEKVMSIASIATMLTKYILVESMLRPETDVTFGKALSYIEKNLEAHLTPDDISRGANISKTSLYKYFHHYFNCTVSEYINKKRVEKSADYLRTTDMSIEIISQKVGFMSASYYTRMFKKYMGTTPFSYRRQK